MLDMNTGIFWLTLFSIVFAAVGVVFAKGPRESLEDFVVARNSQTSHAISLTLLATTMGTWVLFGPAESAVWGGVGAILGYALGCLVPSLVMIPLGERIRELMPNGHTLTEFVHARYGRSVYVFVLFIMVFYLFIGLTAGLTGIAQMVALFAPVPLWLTAAIVMVCTLIYTLYGGLAVTIFTDKVQMYVILPFLFLLFYFAWQATGGITPVLEGLYDKAPELLNPFDSQGFETGVTFFLAVALTGLFYQGTWQRIFAAKTDRVLRNGFLISGFLSFPIVVLLGVFGLAFVGLSLPGEGSTALFNVIMNDAPMWFLIGMIFFGLALIMSSADSTISGINSLVIVDLHRLVPAIPEDKLLKVSRWVLAVVSLIALFVAAQGYSILYLFLLADLFCCAAAFPVFFGFYNQKYRGYQASISIAVGIVAGLFYFPLPGEEATQLYESFIAATFAPVVVSLLLQLLPHEVRFNFANIGKKVHVLGGKPDKVQ